MKMFAMRSTAVLIGVLAITDPALAGVAPVPGPLIGAGVPALALFAAGYMWIRRRRHG